jgi:hypothetical protein
MMTENTESGTPVATPITIEIPIEAIVQGKVVTVSTKSIPIIPIRTETSD